MALIRRTPKDWTPNLQALPFELGTGSHGGHVGAEFLPDISRNVHAPGSEEASRTPRARAEKPRTHRVHRLQSYPLPYHLHPQIEPR